MPTFNQLVRKGRKVQAVKSTAPALQKGYNAKKKVTTDQSSPRREACAPQFVLLHRRSRTPL